MPPKAATAGRAAVCQRCSQFVRLAPAGPERSQVEATIAKLETTPAPPPPQPNP
jgi:hypothetical protein